MKTPRHFQTSKQFSLFILECAIMDRTWYLESITPMYMEPDADQSVLINETKEEIKAMKNRIKSIKDKNKRIIDNNLEE